MLMLPRRRSCDENYESKEGNSHEIFNVVNVNAANNVERESFVSFALEILVRA